MISICLTTGNQLDTHSVEAWAGPVRQGCRRRRPDIRPAAPHTLATDIRHRRIEQIRLVQGELRNCAIEQRKLVEMIATLTRRFPDEEVALAR